jgi:PAS domain S-box-containing protein
MPEPPGETVESASAEWARVAQDLWLDGFMVLRAVREGTGIADFEWEYLNRAASAFLPAPAAGLLHRRLLEAMPEHRDDGLFARYAAVVETGIPHDIEIRYDQPHERWVRNIAVTFGHDRLAVVLRDISERKQAEMWARYLAAVVESSDDAIISKTPQGIITSWNQAATRLFGYSAAEAVGRSIAIIIPPDRLGEEDEILKRVGRGERVDRFETVRRRRDGSSVRVAVTISPVRDAGGTVIGVSKIARDISERARLDDLLRRQADDLAEANRLKDEFLATLSHELRTPLNAILGWSQMLLRGHLDPRDRQAALEAVERNARTQMQIINDVLDVSRIVTGRLRLNVVPVDIVPILAAAVDVVRPAAAAKRIDVIVTVGAGPALVAGDADRLHQVFWNLCSNAVKFTPGRGRVEVGVGRDGGDVVVRVADSGVGISPLYLPRLFGRFSQSDGSSTRFHGGLGLGLAIVRHLVEMHGGSVGAESPGAGQGATFTVRLPAANAETAARDRENSEDHAGAAEA